VDLRVAAERYLRRPDPASQSFTALETDVQSSPITVDSARRLTILQYNKTGIRRAVCRTTTLATADRPSARTGIWPTLRPNPKSSPENVICKRATFRSYYTELRGRSGGGEGGGWRDDIRHGSFYMVFQGVLYSAIISVA